MGQFQSIRREPATSPMEEEAEQIIESLAASYQEIGGRWTKHRRYSRLTSIAALTSLPALFYLIAFSSSVYKSPALFAAIGWIAISFLVSSIFSRKLNKITLDSEEKLFIAAYELTTELRQYPIPLDISYAANELDFIIGELELNWTLEFRLAKEALSSVTEFMKNLRFKLLQALAKGKTDDVRLTVWTLAKLCPLLINEHQKVSQIGEINSEISKLPERKQVEKVKFHVKMRVWIANHSTVKAIGIASVCALVGVVITALGNLLGYPSEGFGAGVSGAIALFIAFLLSPRLEKQ